jgi:hypothetical protein
MDASPAPPSPRASGRPTASALIDLTAFTKLGDPNATSLAAQLRRQEIRVRAGLRAVQQELWAACKKTDALKPGVPRDTFDSFFIAVHQCMFPHLPFEAAQKLANDAWVNAITLTPQRIADRLLGSAQELYAQIAAGARSPAEMGEAPPARMQHIVIIGDGATHGVVLPPPAPAPSPLEATAAALSPRSKAAAAAGGKPGTAAGGGGGGASPRQVDPAMELQFRTTVGRREFCSALFTLADTFCLSCDGAEYVAFTSLWLTLWKSGVLTGCVQGGGGRGALVRC